ncbi:hypothetical protein FHS74_002839 [Nitrospirillum iridis]|uniref:Uncharacterized protein n=1 Tax=Nitrospirillum iridis TaxID=765888 RepID=A0A7X0B163_9PROT|nr:hypothetical protein [Nitrospirillum iridis]
MLICGDVNTGTVDIGVIYRVAGWVRLTMIYC